MGEQGLFKQGITRMMNTTDGKRAVEQLKAARRGGITSEKLPLDNFYKMRFQLNQALNKAEDNAFAALESDMKMAIEVRRLAAARAEEQAEAGIIPFTQTRK